MVLSPWIQQAIMATIEVELRPWPRPDDRDEGRVTSDWSPYTRVPYDEGLRWRRGTTARVRQLFDAGLALDASLERACEYLIVYLVDPVPPIAGPDHAGTGYLRPLRIFSTESVAPAIIRYLTERQHENRPVGPQRGGLHEPWRRYGSAW
jgi:hypothetical protein